MKQPYIEPTPRAWTPVTAVGISTGLKSWPVAWATRGDFVKTSTVRGDWEILAIERNADGLVNIEVRYRGSTRVFRAANCTLLKTGMVEGVTKGELQ